MSDNPNYCGTCYSAAEKAGRPVRKTDVYPYPICGLCENRIRNGLVHYIPSNGTEGAMFERNCERCRHGKYHEEGWVICDWKILDQMLDSAMEPYDSAKSWYDPAILKTEGDDGHPMCPAECLKFTHKNDGDGEFRDPPPKDCVGQMMLGELLTVKEREPVKATAKI